MKEDASATYCSIKDTLIFCPRAQNKSNIDIDSAKLSSICAGCNEDDVRNMLLKVNIRDNFAVNFKRVNDFQVKLKTRGLMFLLGKEEVDKTPDYIKKLKSDGVTLMMLRRMYCLLDHRCSRCKEWVVKNRNKEQSIKGCIRCGTSPCESCYNDDNDETFCCPSCKTRMADLNKMPSYFVMAKHVNKAEDKNINADITVVEREYNNIES